MKTLATIVTLGTALFTAAHVYARPETLVDYRSPAASIAVATCHAANMKMQGWSVDLTQYLRDQVSSEFPNVKPPAISARIEQDPPALELLYGRTENEVIRVRQKTDSRFFYCDHIGQSVSKELQGSFEPSVGGIRTMVTVRNVGKFAGDVKEIARKRASRYERDPEEVAAAQQVVDERDSIYTAQQRDDLLAFWSNFRSQFLPNAPERLLLSEIDSITRYYRYVTEQMQAGDTEFFPTWALSDGYAESLFLQGFPVDLSDNDVPYGWIHRFELRSGELTFSRECMQLTMIGALPAFMLSDKDPPESIIENSTPCFQKDP